MYFAKNVGGVINGKRVIGSKKDILEIKNAHKLYGMINEFNPSQEKGLLRAHKVLMDELIKSAVKNRSWLRFREKSGEGRFPSAHPGRGSSTRCHPDRCRVPFRHAR